MKESTRGRKQEESPRTELSEAIAGVTNEILYECVPQISILVKDRAGLDSSRDVEGRENEDSEAEIDLAAQDHIYKALDSAGRKRGLSFIMHSEHGSFTTGSRGPYYDFVVDPVENTDELVKHLEHFYVATWFLFSIYDLSHNSLGGGACNLRSLQTYVARQGVNFQHNFFETHSENDIELRKAKQIDTLDDENLVISAYRAKPKYDRAFREHFTKLSDDRHPKSTLISTGGNYIYVPVALGIIHLHIAPIEPLNEVFAGLPFAENAGAEVSIVERDGNRIPIKFDPILLTERSELVLASLSPSLMNVATRYYVRSFESGNQTDQISAN